MHPGHGMAAAPSTSAPLPPAPPCPAAAILNAKQPAPPPAAVMDGEQPAPPPDYKGLNDKQQRAVTASLRVPLCVVAGAGSGKTSVLTNRIKFMLDSGVPPAKVLAVTFTTAAADEMRERLRRLCGRAAAKAITVATFHSLSLAICRSHAHRVGRGVDFSVWTTKQQVKAVRRAMEAAAIAASNAGGSGSDGTRSIDPSRLLTGMLRAKARGMNPSDVTDAYSRTVYEQYEQYLLDANAFDMLDFLLVATRVLTIADDVRASMHAKHTHVLVGASDLRSEA